MINWQEAPQWANYAAQDDSGEWNWFECEPAPKSGLWMVSEGKRETMRVQRWKHTLTRRSLVIDARQDYHEGHNAGSMRGAIAKYLCNLKKGEQLKIKEVLNQYGEKPLNDNVRINIYNTADMLEIGVKVNIKSFGFVVTRLY